MRIKAGAKGDTCVQLCGKAAEPNTHYSITPLFHLNCYHICVCVSVYLSLYQIHITWHQAFLCVVMWHTHHSSWPLLPPTAPSNVETMATASWNQFVTHCLHFVRSARQSSGAAVGENGAWAFRSLKSFENGGRLLATTQQLPVRLPSDHSLYCDFREKVETPKRHRSMQNTPLCMPAYNWLPTVAYMGPRLF